VTDLPDLPGILRAGEVLATAESIAAVQRPDGMIPWYPGGHCDPWNHVEAAMALTVSGLVAEADRAYQWLLDTQLPDGSWFNYYLASGVKDPRLDTNVCAYLATGAWHRYLSTGDVGGLEWLWPALSAGVDFVLRWQRVDGSIAWSLDPSGVVEPSALLTGSSSIYHSLRCAIACAELLGYERPDWELAAGRLAHAIAHQPDCFARKDEFAMDWYYPVLSGALSCGAALARMDAGWSTFVLEGRGVRCVSSGDWVTAAETAECVLALDAVGQAERARDLLTAVQALRRPDGTYWTGIVYPDEVTFPPLERSTYTAGAVVLAADALSGSSPTSGLFRGEGLPTALDLTEPAPGARREPVAPSRRGPIVP
jgi:hypothetical protein